MVLLAVEAGAVVAAHPGVLALRPGARGVIAGSHPRRPATSRKGSSPNPVLVASLRSGSPHTKGLKGRASRPGDGAPERLVIPVIGVDSGLEPLGLNADGTMEVPSDFAEAGWFTGAPKPGDPGPSVIVGHVSSKSGPAVFYRLAGLRPGDVVEVLRRKGSVAKFVVDSVSQFPKDAFPSKRVYGNVVGSALRLITCGGSFNSATGHFDDNIIVFTHLVN